MVKMTPVLTVKAKKGAKRSIQKKTNDAIKRSPVLPVEKKMKKKYGKKNTNKIKGNASRLKRRLHYYFMLYNTNDIE